MKIVRKHGSVNMEYLPGGGTYIHSIVVDEGFRGNGYGSNLLVYALRKARYPVYLLCDGELGGDPRRLCRWYARFGFVKKCGRDIGWNYNMVRWE